MPLMAESEAREHRRRLRPEPGSLGSGKRKGADGLDICVGFLLLPNKSPV